MPSTAKPRITSRLLIRLSSRTGATSLMLSPVFASFAPPRTRLDRDIMDARTLTDPIPLAQALMRCASVTPVEAGAMDVAEHALSKLGFRTRRMKFGAVDNLYARLGAAQPNFCFAGHLD